MLQLGRKAKVACNGLIFAAVFFTCRSPSYALSLSEPWGSGEFPPTDLIAS